jgi:hypothetical protein
MNKEELRIRPEMGWRGGDADAFLRRLEIAKTCPEFLVDPTQEVGISLLARRSGRIRGIFTWATQRFSKQRELMGRRTRG